MSLSAQGENSEATKKFDVKEFIFSHTGDSYGWHITTWGDTHITIPLPIIAYSKEKGWHLFMSSKLDHKEYKGFYIAQEGKYVGKLAERNAAGEEVRPIDLSLTKNAAALIINSIILICIVMSLVRWYRKRPSRSVPGGFVGAMEMFVMNIHDDLIKPCVGAEYKRYAPYLLTAFFFILINNLMGLIPFFPGGASTTGNMAVTMVLALCTFFVVNLFGNKEYWKEILWPDVPVWMKIPIPLMPVIELFGIFTKPFALMIRLFANIMAGHAIILGLTCLVFLTVVKGPTVNASMSAISVILSVLMSFLELLVAYIQAYVFTMLSAVFIGLSRPKAHHHKTKEAKLEIK
ncbi:MAG: F0F1 ATP synthase subunit A [Bacteroidales bacterium]|nr:F0F1 ATP synthase subunit A [Bacteroidales bacterium]MCL2132742.1 F0F1 ATP synthase subunit A [Bacteroidales bacterium]